MSNFWPWPCAPSPLIELLLQYAGEHLLIFCLLLRFSMRFFRKLNFAWLNALPRLRRVAHSSQVDILENSDWSCLAFFYRHSSPDQGNGSLSGMPDSRPGEFSKCGQSLLIVTYYGTWVLIGMGGGGILVLWLCSTCSPVILEVTLSLETHCRLLCFDKINILCLPSMKPRHKIPNFSSLTYDVMSINQWMNDLPNSYTMIIEHWTV